MNKNYILIGVIVLIVLGGLGFWMTGKKSGKEAQESLVPTPEVEIVPTINPTDLGLKFSARSDNHAVKFAIPNAAGISSIDYEISYLAKGDIPRGAIGHVDVKPTDTKIETSYIDLGTCSSGKCKYDEGVTSVKLLLKITKKDDKTYQSETSLEL